MDDVKELADGTKVFRACKAFVVDGDDRLLMLRLNLSRMQLGHRAELGTWDVPGGRAKQGESAEQALKREIMEEAGIMAEIGGPLAEFEFSPRDAVVVRGTSYLCRPLSHEVRLADPEGEHDECRWVPLAESLKYDIARYMVDGINAALSMVRGAGRV